MRLQQFIQPLIRTIFRSKSINIFWFLVLKLLSKLCKCTRSRVKSLNDSVSVQKKRPTRRCSNRSATIYHLMGTCKMGSDNYSVVDEWLRVHGVTGLRGADYLIMPNIVSGNSNASAIMISEKASEMILEEARA